MPIHKKTLRLSFSTWGAVSWKALPIFRNCQLWISKQTCQGHCCRMIQINTQNILDLLVWCLDKIKKISQMVIWWWFTFVKRKKNHLQMRGNTKDMNVRMSISNCPSQICHLQATSKPLGKQKPKLWAFEFLYNSSPRSLYFAPPFWFAKMRHDHLESESVLNVSQIHKKEVLFCSMLSVEITNSSPKHISSSHGQTRVATYRQSLCMFITCQTQRLASIRKQHNSWDPGLRYLNRSNLDELCHRCAELIFSCWLTTVPLLPLERSLVQNAAQKYSGSFKGPAVKPVSMNLPVKSNATSLP